MDIPGPLLDEAKKQIGRPACGYLRYSAPKRNADGTLVLAENGRPVTQRYRPYHETKAEALADFPRIPEQHEVAGSGQFIFNRQAAVDYEGALKLAGSVSMLEFAKFWRLHHPEKPKRKYAAASYTSLFAGQHSSRCQRRQRLVCHAADAFCLEAGKRTASS